MSKPILEIENISKLYKIDGKQDNYLSIRDSFKSMFKPARKEEFWALKDISFNVHPGDSIGIIGKNGAGKSTLLKILSRITPPTTGKITSRGRIASLLEVGTGFHGELSGRENVFMNGSILGMKRAEIIKNFDAIVEFSGVEKFIDTPLKHYSSGMQVRLAFAVAAFLENEILIVDEVLAVGDAEFQKKCMGKMKDVADSGRTVLFVSHNIAAVKSLCNRGVVLNSGRFAFDGTEMEAAQYYIDHSSFEESFKHVGNLENAPGNDKLRLLNTSVSSLRGEILSMQSGLQFNIGFYSLNLNVNLDITFEVRTLDDVVVFHSGVILPEKISAHENQISVTIPEQLLNAGTYILSLIFGENQRFLLARFDDIIKFEIMQENNGSNNQQLPGIVSPKLILQS